MYNRPVSNHCHYPIYETEESRQGGIGREHQTLGQGPIDKQELQRQQTQGHYEQCHQGNGKDIDKR